MVGSLPTVREGGWYHVVNRGAEGSPLFREPDAMTAFVDVLSVVARTFRVEVHAYCVMGNHYHLLVRAEESELRRAIERLESGLPGLQGNARLCRLSMGRHLLRVTRYIHRNPLDAGLVKRLDDWPWSSYRGYLDRRREPSWLRTDAVLGWLGYMAQRRRYRDYVQG